MENFELVTLPSGEPGITSEQIADVTGKRHDHIRRDIKSCFEELGINPHDHEMPIRSEAGRSKILIALNEPLALTVVSGYDTKLRYQMAMFFHEHRKNLPPQKWGVEKNPTPEISGALNVDEKREALASIGQALMTLGEGLKVLAKPEPEKTNLTLVTSEYEPAEAASLHSQQSETIEENENLLLGEAAKLFDMERKTLVAFLVQIDYFTAKGRKPQAHAIKNGWFVQCGNAWRVTPSGVKRINHRLEKQAN